MTWPLAIAIYFVIWWTLLFAVLPFGVRTQGEAGEVVPGTPSSAPAAHRMVRVAVITTIGSFALLGLLWPDLGARLFPKESMKVLFPVSQLGLAAYMFVVGLEFRMDIIRKRLHSAVAVSLAGMLAPFVLSKFGPHRAALARAGKDKL
jgi:predicted secreted protein